MMEHSPLGASGASRWMNCPGSVRLSESVDKGGDSEYAKEGTAAHALASECLVQHTEPWQYIGQEFEEFTVNKEMSDAVSVYTTAITDMHRQYKNNSISMLVADEEMEYIEQRFHCPLIHKSFFGTTDYAKVEGDTLYVWDYKHGRGVIVEVQNNPQTMYYAAGVLESAKLWQDSNINKVVLHIVQPRAPHSSGPVRSWGISKKDLVNWLDETLVPAMNLTATSDKLKSGEHCRFCPVVSKSCPEILSNVDEVEETMAKKIEELSNADVSRFLKLAKTVKLAISNAEKTAYARLEKGQKIEGYKLVNAKSNRKWRDEAEAALEEKFGDRAFKEVELKSPAEIEKMSGGKALAKEFAFKPPTGLKVGEDSDARPAVNKDTKSLFKPTSKKGRK